MTVMKAISFVLDGGVLPTTLDLQARCAPPCH
jgi:hypothetical protein